MAGVEPILAFRFDIDGLICVGVIVVIVLLGTSCTRSAHRCPRCHEINREAAIFCSQCGTRLPGR